MATDSSERHWHCLDSEAAAAHLDSDLDKGLTADAAGQRLEQAGPNVLHETGRRHPLVMLASQFTDFMILVLIAAAVIAGIIGEPQDTIAIVVIVFLNGIIGFVQEYRAERAMAALKKMASPQARVIRDGQPALIDATHLVPGDLVRAGSRQHPAGRPAPDRAGLAQGRRVRAHRRVAAGRQAARAVTRNRPAARRPSQLGLQGDHRDLRPRARPGGGDRHEDRTGENRRTAVRGVRQDPAAKAPGALWPASGDGGAGDLRDHVRRRLAARRAAAGDAAHCGQPGGRRHPRGAAGGGHHLARAGRGAHGRNSMR